MWEVWDKKSEINGFEADFIMSRNSHLVSEETIFIKFNGSKVSHIEGKSLLAKHYGVDPALPDDEFIAEYERILAMPPEEIPEEIPEEEEPDTTTYAELAQVYREGVNSIE